MTGDGDDERRRAGETPSQLSATLPSPMSNTPPPPHPTSPSPLLLSVRERELLRPEVATLVSRLDDPALRDSYAMLLEGVDRGSVPAAALDRLEGLLEMGLQTGRFRRQHGPIDAQVLYRLYSRTPRGMALATALEGVNQALAALDGQLLAGLAITAKAPGEYELSVETENCRMAVAVGAGGVHLTSVETGV